MSEIAISRQSTHQVVYSTVQRFQEMVYDTCAEDWVHSGEGMFEGLFSLTHLLIMLFVSLFLFGIPFLLIFRLARRWDKRLQLRPGVRVSFVAVALGGITAFVASIVLTLPFVIYLMVKHDPLHAPEGSAATAFSGWFYGLAIGPGCSVLGGYIAARVAQHDELLNGLLSSFLWIAIGIYPVLSSWHSQSVLMGIFPLLAAPAFALLGGYLRQTQKRMGRTPGILGPPPDVH